MNKLIIIFLFVFVAGLSGQSVKELISSYSGEVVWEKKAATVTFKTTGTIYFKDKTGKGKNPLKDHKNQFWEVPQNVKHISIEKNVTVTGAFHAFNDLTIEGKDRKTSVIFGTDLQEWTHVNNPGGQELKEWYYVQIQNFKGVTTIKNLTILNPFSYFVRGYGPVVHMSDCNLIDNRGGHQNHSDGFCGGDGSTVDNCYFECGDDVFKAYFSYTVTNCTINMIDNSVPIQLGWGSYSNGSVCNFKNLKITGMSGRHNSDNAIISGRRGHFTVTINIDGCEIENPNAVLVSLWNEKMVLEGEIKNADIKLKAYTDRRTAGTSNLTICGDKEQKAEYGCVSEE